MYKRQRPRLRAVEELETAPTLPGRAWPRLLQLAERAVEHGGRDPGDVLGEEGLDVVEQPPEAAAGLRRDRDGRGPLPETPVEVPPGLVQVDGRDVPLGKDDERGAPCLPRDVGDGEVLLDDALRGVDEDERDIRPLGGLERPQLRVVCLLYTSPSPRD